MTAEMHGRGSSELLRSIVHAQALSASPPQLNIPLASTIEDAALLTDLENIHGAWDLVAQVELSSDNPNDPASGSNRLDNLVQAQSALNASYTRLIQYLLEQNQWLTRLVGELEAAAERDPEGADDAPAAI